MKSNLQIYYRKGFGEMTASRILKWVTGGFEAILGIPILGASIVLGLAYTPLILMLILHIITLILTKKDNGPAVGSILGIVTSVVAVIPFVGFVMHILTAVFLMINAATPNNPNTVQSDSAM